MNPCPSNRNMGRSAYPTAPHTNMNRTHTEPCRQAMQQSSSAAHTRQSDSCRQTMQQNSSTAHTRQCEPCRQAVQQGSCSPHPHHTEPCRQTMQCSNSMESPRQAESCPVRETISRSCQTDLSRMNQEQLLCYINEVSFVVSDMLLYLDTHPNDQRALDYCNDHIAMRNHALKEYAQLYGPLTIDTADDASSKSWEWVCTPWPWEGRLK